MSQALKKRGRELEALPVSADVKEAKRFHGEEMDRLCNVLVLDKNLSQEEEVYAPTEEVVNGVMKSLEEEIGMPCFTFDPSSNSGNSSASSNISSGQEGETLASDAHGTGSTVDISLGASNSGVEMVYIMDSSDDELAIPLSPFLDFKGEIWQSPQETSEALPENPDLKSLSEIWHFEDNFEIYKQFELYEDACEASELQYYMNRDFVSQDMSFDGEFSAGWNLETADFL